jgi:prephenate dehydrogenase
MFIEPDKTVVGIIGGKGGMGNLFARILREKGFSVLISDMDPKPANKELIEQSDVVIFSVPLHLSSKIIEDEIKHTRKGQLVIDLSSLKEKQVAAMLKGKAEVVGIHPMFGPAIDSLRNQKVIFCPARVSEDTYKSLLSLFKGLGIQTTEMKPKDHDKMMALIQVVPHLKTMLMAEVLHDQGINMRQTLKGASPMYRLELDILGRIFAQNSEMYASIIAHNPQSKDIIKSLRKNLAAYEKAIQKSDSKFITKRFLKLKRFFGPFVNKAFEESQKVISFMQRW